MSTPAASQITSFTGSLQSQLTRSFSSSASTNKINVTSIGSPSVLASLLSQQEDSFIKSRPHLILFPSAKEIETFKSWMSFFEPEASVNVFPALDVLPNSGLSPNPTVTMKRAGWLTLAQEAQSGIFACDVQSFSQKTLPPEEVNDQLLEISLEDELPSDFSLQLKERGYRLVPLVEDLGCYALRGGILDIFPPSSKKPVRIELFGDLVESIRYFDIESQRSQEEIQSFLVGPAKEVCLREDTKESAIQRLRSHINENQLNEDAFSDIFRSLAQNNSFLGEEFYLPFFYENLNSALDHFLAKNLVIWIYDPLERDRQIDNFQNLLKEDFRSIEEGELKLSYELLYSLSDPGKQFLDQKQITFSRVDVTSDMESAEDALSFPSITLNKKSFQGDLLKDKIKSWLQAEHQIKLICSSESQMARASVLLEDVDSSNFQIVQGDIPESLILPNEHLVFLKADEAFGRQRTRKNRTDQSEFNEKASALSFGDLKPGDLIVHKDHGVGVYNGLSVMSIDGADSEFIELKYKDGDKLFLPVYRVHQIQKYSGPQSSRILDRLGGQQWTNTKTKVRAKLRDIAADLLKLYVARSQAEREPFSEPNDDYLSFEAKFPFEETVDQKKAIDAVVSDMTSEKPMDRLVCGDVGFGKTEVALRATYKAAQDGRQVALLAPTTVLTYQHFENFKKRLHAQGLKVKCLNRFVNKTDIKETIQGLKDGSVDVVIGTHRLLSKDVGFKDLGLLIIDEEQKFGVVHKEKIRTLKQSIDTLTLSATPIPRTLNMSLLGLRDLSLISTAPVDRLPTRTFVCKFNQETIRKAISAEVERGGQVFFIHNRVQSIHGVCDELRQILPSVRFRVAHGQMEEKELESVVVEFFEHKIDVLVCTTIIESGLDIPKANTMFIDRANNFGLSQLYQLRGRVGRGNQRAYCYLLLPRTGTIDKEAQERLKIIQENSALGSGIRIAHYDLELRGSGNILGEDQSGNINAVGYELYLELFEEALKEAKGEKSVETLEPEINVRIPAFIPDKYIKDIRTRLSYYKTLSQISSIEEIDKIEDELRDLFGKPPEPTLNLLGLMLLRLVCKSLSIRDLSSTPTSIALAFTEKTPLPADKVVALTLGENKKYGLTPDNRLKVRMKEVTWPKIYEELQRLERLVD